MLLGRGCRGLALWVDYPLPRGNDGVLLLTYANDLQKQQGLRPHLSVVNTAILSLAGHYGQVSNGCSIAYVSTISQNRLFWLLIGNGQGKIGK